MTTVSELEKLTENRLPERGNANQAFWCEEKDLEKIELFQGDHVRLKTKGGGPLIGKEIFLAILVIQEIQRCSKLLKVIFFLLNLMLIQLTI